MSKALPNRIITRDNLYCAEYTGDGHWDIRRMRVEGPRLGKVVFDKQFLDAWYYSEAAVYSVHALAAIKYLTERIARVPQ